MIKSSFFKIVALGAVLIFAASCKKSSSSDPDPGNGGGGGAIPVANGFYIASNGATPVTGGKLTTENVEAANFGVQTRDGYLAGYYYLPAGTLKIVQVVDQAAFKTFGAVVSAVGLGASDSDKGYDMAAIGTYTDGGAAINVDSAGIYKVVMDQSTSEIMLYAIEYASVIGDAAPSGWANSDTQVMSLVGEASATSAKFELAEVVLRKGSWKIRFNSRWKIDRRSDKTSYLPEAGYVAQLNYGGDYSTLVAGGSNFSIAQGDDAKYKVTATWAPVVGFKLAVVNVGEAPVVTFDPTTYAWGIVGAGGPSASWDNDVDLNYEGVEGTTYTWKGTFDVTGEFKFRTNDSWSYNKGYSDVTLTGADAGDFSDVGGNFKVAAAGNYTFTLSTSDDGANWTVNVVKNVAP